ncbi:hypothetical protein, partial [Pseudomonas aeruginosa]
MRVLILLLMLLLPGLSQAQPGDDLFEARCEKQTKLPPLWEEPPPPPGCLHHNQMQPRLQRT